MPRGKPTSEFTKGRIIGLSQSNKSIREISKILKVAKSTVNDIIKTYKNTCTCEIKKDQAVLNYLVLDRTGN